MEIAHHKLVQTGYLEFYSLAVEQLGDVLVAKESDVPVLTVQFDGHDRLAKLDITFRDGDPAIRVYREGPL